jgi:hypothetical protein
MVSNTKSAKVDSGSQMTITAVMETFATCLRILRVTMCGNLSCIYEQEMDKDLAHVLAAQVVNYLNADEARRENVEESLRPLFDRIMRQVPDRAMKAMRDDHLLKEAVVSTLRMRAVLQYALDGESFLTSPCKKRIEVILKEFGPEFPREVVTDEYIALVYRYRQARTSANSG